MQAAETAAERSATSRLVTVASGGDTVAALNHAGAADRFTYISIVGVAFLEWLEGKALPGVEILRAKPSASSRVWEDTRVSSGVK